MKNSMITLIVFLSTNTIYSQNKSTEDMKLKNVETEVVVDATKQQVWEVLSSFGDVGTYHSGIISSKSLNGSGNIAENLCERECVISDGKKPIIVKERILEIEEGKYFTYEVYDAQNFPVTKMLVTFGVKTNQANQVVIYFKNDYLLKPKFLSGMMKGKIRSGGYDALIAYKHYIETGEKNADMKAIKKRYK